MWNKTITIFNKRFDKSTRSDKYYRTIIQNVFIDDTLGSSTSKNGIDGADSIFIAIPTDNISNYLEPLEYQKKDYFEKYFTIVKGDIVVKGEVKEDYQTLKDIQSNYDHVYTITKIDYKDFGHLPHFEIAGK